MATAVRDATAAGARVINISATTPTDTPVLRAAVDYALAHDVVVVASAGNDDPSTVDTTGTAPPAVYYPAAYPGVLAVAATGTDDRRTDASHSGTYVGIGAPGKDVVSTGPNGPGRYAMLSGTSFATPFVAGTAALIRSYRPGLTAAQVVARLKATADPPPTGVQNADVGAGIVDPYAAVAALIPGEQHATPVATRAPAQALPARPPRPDGTSRTLALAGAALAVLLVAAAFGLAAVLPNGRLRRWRPSV
jgi:subtilisin family serine protease